MRSPWILACLAVLAAAAPAAAPPPLDDDQPPAVEADDAQVYFGSGRTAKAPAVVDADALFAAIAEYQRIVEERLTDRDVRYSFLMLRATKKFRKAVALAAREEKRDLVGNAGSVKWGGREVPDITATALSHVRAQEAVAALRPRGGAISPTGVLSFAPEAKPVELDLSSTKLSDAGLAAVKDLEALRRLDLTATPVGDDGLAHLGKLDGLESLSLAGTNVTDGGLARLEGKAALRVLDLAGTRVTDGGLASVAKIPGLRELALAGTVVGDGGVARLAGMKGLASLDLAGTKVTAKVLETLRGMEGLRRVVLPAAAAPEKEVAALREARPDLLVDVR